MSSHRALRPSTKPSAGFTLIELIVVVTIISILAAIAIPNYSEHVLRGARAEAKTQLLQLAQWQERFRTENNRYAESADVPAGLLAVRAGGSGAVRYNIAVDRPTSQTFTLTARRSGSVATDVCGDFTLTSAGVQGAANNTRPAAECWAR